MLFKNAGMGKRTSPDLNSSEWEWLTQKPLHEVMEVSPWFHLASKSCGMVAHVALGFEQHSNLWGSQHYPHYLLYSHSSFYRLGSSNSHDQINRDLETSYFVFLCVYGGSILLKNLLIFAWLEAVKLKCFVSQNGSFQCRIRLKMLSLILSRIECLQITSSLEP